jgi:hypothetical protein
LKGFLITIEPQINYELTKNELKLMKNELKKFKNELEVNQKWTRSTWG